MDTDLDDLRPGIYRHWKGPLYQVLGYAHDANDERRLCVVYMPLQLDGAHEGPRLAVRSYGDMDDAFDDWVHPDDGTVCLNDCHGSIPRFRWMGYAFKEWMLDASLG